MKSGIINLYKPKGITSSTAVSKVKRILGEKTVGHMGTLDPAGEGILLIGVGKGTRLFDYFLKKDKRYEADFTFGYQTDTLDGDGTVILSGGSLPSREEIEQNLVTQVGKQMQMPPAYSAKSIGGVRAYDLARQGKQVDLQPSAIEIYSAKVLSFDGTVARVLIHCSSGTYIRSVCRDLAASCSTFATMTAIVRVTSGEYLVENATSLDSLQIMGREAIISLKDALKELQTVELDCKFKRQLDNGIKINVIDAELDDKFLKNDFVLYCADTLYGIANIADGKIVIKTFLKD